jgi:RNA polymerase sigma-70 factor (ECF subfamily)
MIRELEFKILCNRHSDEVYRYARSMLGNPADAEDAVQEVLLRLWRNLTDVPFLKARAWILRTTRNYCLDQIRRRTNQSAPQFVSDELLEQHPDEYAPNPQAATESSDLMKRISHAIRQLPEILRSVFILYEINGLRYREIAETLSIPINTVKVYISRARKQLQQLLTKETQWMSTCNAQ